MNGFFLKYKEKYKDCLKFQPSKHNTVFTSCAIANACSSSTLLQLSSKNTDNGSPAASSRLSIE
jgi:hypothetical protein